MNLINTVRICNSIGKTKWSLNTNKFSLDVFSPKYCFYKTSESHQEIDNFLSSKNISWTKYKIYNFALPYNDVVEGKYDYPICDTYYEKLEQNFKTKPTTISVDNSFEKTKITGRRNFFRNFNTDFETKPKEIPKTISVCNSIGKTKYSLNTKNFILTLFSPKSLFYETHATDKEIEDIFLSYDIPAYKYKIYKEQLPFNDVVGGKYDSYQPNLNIGISTLAVSTSLNN
jgi:hypothetical protein